MNGQWTCAVCGAVHEGTPLSWGFDAPIYWGWLADAERDSGYCDTDLCWFTDDDGDLARFIRGTIELPVLDYTGDDDQAFIIGVWVSLSEANFDFYRDLPDAGADDQSEPWFGWLSNRIPPYDDTLNLKTRVHLRGEGLRPCIEVQPSDHALSRDQHQGITLTRARERGAHWLHS
jgi:hypothetical protein